VLLYLCLSFFNIKNKRKIENNGKKYLNICIKTTNMKKRKKKKKTHDSLKKKI